MKSNKNEGAIKDYDIAISMNKNYTLAYFNRGLTQAKQKEHVKAIRDINKAIELDSTNSLFYNGRGVSYIALNRYRLAINDLNKAIELNPKNGQAYYNRGYVKHFGLQRTEKACIDWKKALENNYQMAEPLVKRYCK